ncbi:MAG: FAD-dependent oxidoreductase [Hyphomicrobiales bacterium]|nr:FAD-dependent oxidoreductase [Hyphomicrobiales bacterium]
MGQNDYPDSWYAATRWDDPARPQPAASVKLDVCIVGGGFAGLHIGRLLAERGLGVAVLERRRIGWGASGRNGGFVSPGFAQRAAPIIARVGETAARALYGLSREGVELVREVALAADPALIMGTGKLTVYRTKQGADFAARTREMAARLGTATEPWSVERVRAVARTQRYFEASHDPSAFQLHPLNLALALARRIERAGGLVHEGTQAVALIAEGAGWRVRTGSGPDISARHVVLAGNADLGGIHRAAAQALLPVATYVAVTEPLGPRLAQALTWRGALSDSRRAGDYYRIVAGDRLLWGGRITTDTREPPALRAMMRRDILSVYPQLEDVSISHAWPGVMGYATHMMPHVTRLKDGLWLSSAFGGHGVAQTAAVAIVLAAAIADGDGRWRMFSPWAVRWAGGPVGRAATQGAYWWMQACDWIDERAA